GHAVLGSQGGFDLGCRGALVSEGITGSAIHEERRREDENDEGWDQEDESSEDEPRQESKGGCSGHRSQNRCPRRAQRESEHNEDDEREQRGPDEARGARRAEGAEREDGDAENESESFDHRAASIQISRSGCMSRRFDRGRPSGPWRSE